MREVRLIVFLAWYKRLTQDVKNDDLLTPQSKQEWGASVVRPKKSKAPMSCKTIKQTPVTVKKKNTPLKQNAIRVLDSFHLS